MLVLGVLCSHLRVWLLCTQYVFRSQHAQLWTATLALTLNRPLAQVEALDAVVEWLQGLGRGAAKHG